MSLLLAWLSRTSGPPVSRRLPLLSVNLKMGFPKHGCCDYFAWGEVWAGFQVFICCFGTAHASTALSKHSLAGTFLTFQVLAQRGGGCINDNRNGNMIKNRYRGHCPLHYNHKQEKMQSYAA